MKVFVSLLGVSLLAFSLAPVKGVEAAAPLDETLVASQAPALESGDRILERGKADRRGRNAPSKRGG